MLEAHAAYVRDLSKDGWYANDDCCDDYFHLHRDLTDATQVFVEQDPPDQLSTGEEGPAAADHCQRLQTPAGSNLPDAVISSDQL